MHHIINNPLKVYEACRPAEIIRAHAQLVTGSITEVATFSVINGFQFLASNKRVVIVLLRRLVLVLLLLLVVLI